jgi:hypothetical protein
MTPSPGLFNTSGRAGQEPQTAPDPLSQSAYVYSRLPALIKRQSGQHIGDIGVSNVACLRNSATECRDFRCSITFVPQRVTIGRRRAAIIQKSGLSPGAI